MTDQTFVPTADDQVEDEITRRVRQRQERNAPRDVTGPEKVDRAFRDQASSLLAAVNVTDYTHRDVLLPELTRRFQRSGQRKNVVVRIRQLALQEMVASKLLPRTSMLIVNDMIKRGVKASKSARQAANMPTSGLDDFIDQAETLFEGDYAAATDGFYTLVNAVVVTVVTAPDRVYMDYDEATEAGGVWIDQIPLDDRLVIFNTAFELAMQEARQADAFREPAVGASDGGAAPESESALHQAERADSI